MHIKSLKHLETLEAVTISRPLQQMDEIWSKDYSNQSHEKRFNAWFFYVTQHIGNIEHKQLHCPNDLCLSNPNLCHVNHSSQTKTTLLQSCKNLLIIFEHNDQKPIGKMIKHNIHLTSKYTIKLVWAFVTVKEETDKTILISYSSYKKIPYRSFSNKNDKLYSFNARFNF